jgi:hypothetical protein
MQLKAPLGQSQQGHSEGTTIQIIHVGATFHSLGFVVEGERYACCCSGTKLLEMN